MNSSGNALHVELQRTRRLMIGLNDRRSLRALEDYADELERRLRVQPLVGAVTV